MAEQKPLFSAYAADKAVILVIDPATAARIARLLEHAYATTEDLSASRPLWAWDVAALKRAAADARNVEATDTPRVDVTYTDAPHLKVVDGGGQP